MKTHSRCIYIVYLQCECVCVCRSPSKAAATYLPYPTEKHGAPILIKADKLFDLESFLVIFGRPHLPKKE